MIENLLEGKCQFPFFFSTGQNNMEGDLAKKKGTPQS